MYQEKKEKGMWCGVRGSGTKGLFEEHSYLLMVRYAAQHQYVQQAVSLHTSL
jgi:hypothetical protein